MDSVKFDIVSLNDMQKQIIYRNYFINIVCPQIKQIRKDKQKAMLDCVCCIRLQDNARVVLTEKEIEIITDLTEICDFRRLFQIITENNQTDYSFSDVFNSILYAVEKFYCLSLTKREEFIENANNYNVSYSMFRDSKIDYFSKYYDYIIDDKKFHSGASYGYCIKHVYKFATYSETKKLTLWCMLINTYALKYY
jgi:hypothetical protein